MLLLAHEIETACAVLDIELDVLYGTGSRLPRWHLAHHSSPPRQLRESRNQATSASLWLASSSH